MKWMMFVLLIISGCREFYDEEFEEGDNFTENRENVTYDASLASTDPNVRGITGNSTVDVQGDVVTIAVKLEGVPQNITQLHYSYSPTDCSVVTLTFPNDVNGTRSVNLNETTTLQALKNDSGDTILDNKSFIIKGFSGTNLVTIACGPLNVTGSEDNIQLTDDSLNTDTVTDEAPVDATISTGL